MEFDNIVVMESSEGNLNTDRLNSKEGRTLLVEPRSVDETVQIVMDLYKGAEPELRQVFFRPDAILAIAGIKGRSDGLDYSLVEKDRILTNLKDLNYLLDQDGLELRFNIDKHPTIGTITIDSLLGYEYKSSRFNLLNQKYGLQRFERSLGQDFTSWNDQIDAIFLSAVARGDLTADDRSIYMDGIDLGYPDQAIIDFIDWNNTGRSKELVAANIVSVHPLAKQLATRVPEFDYYPSSANDHEIVENIQNSRRMLQGFYESKAIQQIIAK